MFVVRLTKILFIVVRSMRAEARHPGGRNCNDR